MKTYQLAGKALGLEGLSENLEATYRCFKLLPLSWLLVVVLTSGRAFGQANVLTAHNDIARTGQNLNETILTPSNVNPTLFGRLFTQPVSGKIQAQPLYVSQVAIPNKGSHNVVYVVTSTDWVYAFDADTNGGSNANPLWKVSLLTNTAAAGTYTTNFGVVGTPVIDPTTNTMYLVSSESFVASSGSQTPTYVARLHALNITTGAEMQGGPLQIQASVPGTGSGSVGGTLTFNPQIHQQRPGLLLLNGVLYVAFGSDGADDGSWHGWLFSFSEATLQQLDVFCTSANGIGAGMWMGGSGLAAEVNNPAKPYGRMFVATGNGTYTATYPYSSTMSYGLSVLDFDLTGGQLTVEDAFTPYNEAVLDGQDADLGSGGPVLLPTQTLASGATLKPLVEIGKSGMIYILDRDNNADGSNNPATEYSPAGLGGFNAAGDQVVQEYQTPITAGLNWGAGVWGTEAYWNNTIYSGGTNPLLGASNPDDYAGAGNSLAAYSFVNGVLSTTPSSQSVEQFVFPGPTPSISANGTTNGIVWVLMTYLSATGSPDILLAYDATNLGSTLYSSNTNPSRDSPGGIAVQFSLPTVANGKVYVAANPVVSVYGLLGAEPTAPTPVISPASGTFTGSQTVTITDAVPGATIYYTTNGLVPTSGSAVYSSSSPLVISSNETVTAIASPNGYIQSAPASATYTSTSTTANPVFSLLTATYTGTQTLTITDSSAGAVIYYTLNGSTPTTASAVYSNPLSVPVSETVQAIAVAPGLFASAVVSAAYTIQPVYAIDFSQGFTQNVGLQFNGSTDLDDYRLQLTDGGLNEAGSAFYTTPVNIQAFTTNFGFQLSNPAGNGITFTIQNAASTALGSSGGGLGYASIPNSVAIKFDFFNTAGEGVDSTGLYTNGAMPTVPAINLTGTGINLQSGDNMSVQITYDGTDLTMTITDVLTLATWSNSWPINIPSIVGGNTAYVGFTGGTGTSSSSQKLTSWTYVAGPLSVPNYPAGFDGAGMTLNGGAALNGTRLRLTDGGTRENRSGFFTAPVNIQQFSTNFDFQLTNPNADGITFTIQGDGPTALGVGGDGSLGYTGIANSVAVKFDLYDDEGEGIDSTGLYVNGAPPTIPAVNLTSTGVNLHSGDIFNVQLAYNGVTLTETITDTSTGATATENYTVNIPAIVGGPTANVGFTGGTRLIAATQDILSWTFVTTSTAPAAPAPQIGSVSANYGAPSAIITLTGTNFGATQGASTVTFNGAPGTASAWSNTGITVSVPSLATTGNLVVTAGGLSSSGVPFTVEPSPSITGISPASGPPGTTVTISGQNLLDAQNQGTVSFGGVSLSILNPSNTSLQVVVPAGAVTGAFLVHINGVGNSTSTFTVAAGTAPQISSVSTNYAAPYDANIALTGTNFGASQGTSTVTFNGVSATASAWSNTGITVSVPALATTGNLVVTVNGQSSNGVPFAVEPHLSLTGMSPNQRSSRDYGHD